jgi:hypothetical protein
VTGTETEAFEAMLTHHRALEENVGILVAALTGDAAAGSAHEAASAELAAYLADEVLPHALVEEQTIYGTSLTNVRSQSCSTSPASGAGAPSTRSFEGLAAITCCPATTSGLETTSDGASSSHRRPATTPSSSWGGPGGPTVGSCTSTCSSTPWPPPVTWHPRCPRSPSLRPWRQRSQVTAGGQCREMGAQPKPAASPLWPRPGESELEGHAGTPADRENVRP